MLFRLTPIEIFPDLQLGVQLTSGGDAWTYGAWAELVAANAINRPFYILGIIPHDPSTYGGGPNIANGQIQLRDGTNVDVLGDYSTHTFLLSYNFSPPLYPAKRVPANVQIQARYAASQPDETVRLCIYYRRVP